MACFIAPAATAVVTTTIKKKIPKKYHIEWLNYMLWGGVVMFMVEHFIKGEIIAYPPFLSALQNPANIPAMIQEIVTLGGAMTVATIAVWLVMVFVANRIPKKQNLIEHN
jgi:hypothetical protein